MDCFKDLKVIELASVLAGPAVGMFFSELGAEVIKIENKTTGGDVTRNWKLPIEDASLTSSYYHAVNYNKTSLLLDLTNETDKKQVYELISSADIVISNFRKTSAKKLGFDYSSLQKLKSDIIVGEISAYGKDSDLPGFDAVIQAQTGWMSINGSADGVPTKLPVAMMDLLAAHQLKEGILVALLNKQKNGQGSHVHVSLYDAAISSLANQASNYLNTGYIPKRMGSQHPNIAPYGDLVLTVDKQHILLSIGTEKQFRDFCQIINRVDIPRDPRFADNQGRVLNREELMKELNESAGAIVSNQLILDCKKQSVPASHILALDQVFSTAAAKNLVLTQQEGKNTVSKRVKTAVFKIV